jgi:Holliday junction resolvase RusA-like endonuclease
MSREIFHIVIYGNPYIKKNSQRTIWHKYLKRIIVVYSANYTAWRKDSLMQLGLNNNGAWTKNFQKPDGIDYPINLKCHFYVKDNIRRDMSALYEGIQDVLVEAKVLKDDNFKIIAGHDGSRVFVDKENPRIELWLQEVAVE